MFSGTPLPQCQYVHRAFAEPPAWDTIPHRMRRTASWILAGGAILLGGLWLWSVSADGERPASQPASPPTTRPTRRITAKELQAAAEKLRPLHKKLGKPGSGSWQERFKEPGQTFEQYLRCRPVLPQGKRRVLYIQPIGDFTKSQRTVVDLTAEFMGLYFNLPARVRESLPPTTIPPSARRVHPQWKDRQILTTYVLDKILRPRLPEDAAALLAFTATDLWPGEGWNFVFGQASLRHRVGVWSIYRNGDPDRSPADFRLCLLRTMKTAVHETGHMFSMLHCTAYDCGMCGSMTRRESDARPLALCPECLAKVCWATQSDPAWRFGRIEGFCRKHGLLKEAQRYRRSAKALGGQPTGATEDP